MLPLSFGESGLPVHPLLQGALTPRPAATPTAPWPGSPNCARRPLATGTGAACRPGQSSVISGPGSKSLLFGLLLAIGADVAVPQPSWVSYAAQAG